MSSPSGSSGMLRKSSSGMYSGKPLGSVPTAKCSTPSRRIDSTWISAIVGFVMMPLRGSKGTARPMLQSATKSSVAERKTRQGSSPGRTLSWPVTISGSSSSLALGLRVPGRKLAGSKTCGGALGIAPEGPCGRKPSLSASSESSAGCSAWLWRPGIQSSWRVLGAAEQQAANGSAAKPRAAHLAAETSSEPCGCLSSMGPSLNAEPLRDIMSRCFELFTNFSICSSSKVIVRTWSSTSDSSIASAVAASLTEPLSGSYK
mmetsp:Transcript_101434/g.269722  ORF Transcript_101434/g.269722 Transcript_101434/m.269722 type:complete len:260 (+) Transcript_101434:122-901(+)